MNKILLIVLISSLIALFSCTKGGNSSFDSGSKNSSGGKSGSTARMTIKGDYLYAVDNSSLKIIDISNPQKPNYIKTINLNFGIETIYPFKDYLFLGSNDGMYIYSINNPAYPTQISRFRHATACDPVIANDKYAFITLRYNEVCSRWKKTREIDVVDITNIKTPIKINIYKTKFDPYGLDMNDTVLFVCHGKDGLITYDIEKLKTPHYKPEISSIKGINAYDAILWQNKLFVIGETGFYQYDYSDIHNIKLISSIPRGK